MLRGGRFSGRYTSVFFIIFDTMNHALFLLLIPFFSLGQIDQYGGFISENQKVKYETIISVDNIEEQRERLNEVKKVLEKKVEEEAISESDAPAEEAPAYQLNMDPQMIGVWRRTESYSDPISGFSYVIQETLTLRGDGTVEFSSKSAGGNGGVTGATPGQELKGYWKTEKKFLFTSDFPTGPWMNNGNYLVDAHTMMLKQSGGNKLWNRIQ